MFFDCRTQRTGRGGLWFPVLHLLLLQHSLRTGTENGPVSSPSLSNMPIFGLERTAGHIQASARHSTPKYPQWGQPELHILHTLALTQVSQTGCGWMFSPHPAQCNYPAKTTVLGFPHSSLPQCLTLPTVPTNPTGMLGWDCWALGKNAASHENNSLPWWTKDYQRFLIPLQNLFFLQAAASSCRQKGHEIIKYLNPSFYAQPPGFHCSEGEVVLYKEVEFLVLKFLFWVTKLEKCNFKVDMWTLS